jgi:hypothetical protein
MATPQPPIPQSGRPDVPRGVDLLNRPVLNKGTGVTEDERGKFGLHGLLPPAARALAENSPALKDAPASLLPALTELRQVAFQIAIAVGREARTADIAPKGAENELRQRVISMQWTPAHPSPG